MKFHKKIADPVHGTIGLTKLEIDLLEAPALQRLRNIKQLGLAHFVYPGADFSRLSHSIGVCHIAGLKINALRRAGATISDGQEQACRAAALLHDIGHFPFSHAMEEAVSNYYRSSHKQKKSTANGKPKGGGDGKNSTTKAKSAPPVGHHGHEEIGKIIVQKDSHITRLLNASYEECAPGLVSEIFSTAGQQFGIVKSELDADRLDFLPRTALHTGLPYGSVDIEYLISNLVHHEENFPCLNEKASRAAEHFLLCRLFDRQQVAYHKSVAGFELVLKAAVSFLLKRGDLDCTAPAVEAMIESGVWAHFDDQHVTEKIRKAALQTNDTLESDVYQSILKRKLPKQVFSYDGLRESDYFALLLEKIESKKQTWARKHKTDVNRLLIWPKEPKPLTKTQPKGENPDESIWIQRRNGDVLRLVEVEGSVIKALVDSKLCSLRVYYLPREKDDTSFLDKLRATIEADMKPGNG